jgi:tetratricopeptide (TPR) repeat protein
MNRVVLLAMGLALVLASPAARPESLSDVFERANNSFWNGDYESARQAYSQLLELAGPRPEVLYNLGTTEARLGNFGQAVLMYEKVIRLSPDDEDARQNLSVLREHLARRANEAGRDADLAPSVSALRALVDRFSTNGAAYIFLALELLFFAVLLTRRFLRADLPRLSLGVLSGVLGLLAVALLAVLLGRLYLDREVREAVVLRAGQADAYEGPASEVRRFGLEEGTRVQVVGAQDGWKRLRDAEGRDGWVSADDLGEI